MSQKNEQSVGFDMATSGVAETHINWRGVTLEIYTEVILNKQPDG